MNMITILRIAQSANQITRVGVLQPRVRQNLKGIGYEF